MNFQDLVIGKTYLKSTLYEKPYKVIYQGLFGGSTRIIKDNHTFESESGIVSAMSNDSVSKYISEIK